MQRRPLLSYGVAFLPLVPHTPDKNERLINGRADLQADGESFIWIGYVVGRETSNATFQLYDLGWSRC